MVFSSSDASSEYLSAVEVTDSEDTGRNGSIIGQEAGQQVAVVGGSYTGLSPMIIMNNFVLKQVTLNCKVHFIHCTALFKMLVVLSINKNLNVVCWLEPRFMAQ